MAFQFQSLAAIVLAATATNNHSGHSSLFVDAQNNSQRSNSGGGVADRAPVTCPQSPSLHCKNGSECEEGIANFGRHHDHLDLQTHESGYYCKCLGGFIGHECGIQVDDCAGDTGYNPSDPTGTLQSCYHGSECQSTLDSSGEGFYCDCAKLNQDTEPTAKKYAGMLCQHESTSLCAASLVGENAPDQQFCTNHGKCVKMVTGGDPHPGCVCREDYVGDRCEVRVDPMLEFANDNPPQGTNSVLGKVLFGIFIVSIIGTMIGIVVIHIKIQKAGAADGDGSAAAQGTRPATKFVVGEADLDPDGSGILGKPPMNTTDDADGHLELSLKGEEPVPPEALEGNNSALEENRKEEDTAPGDSDVPEIV